MFKLEKDPLAVIEFNDATVRVCRSVLRRSTRVVTHCFSFPLALSWQDQAVEIRTQLRNHKIPVSRTILMLSRDKSINHTWSFPSINPEEIRAMVRLRVLRECFGSDKNNVAYDYRMIGTDREGCSKVSVFLLQKQVMEKYIRILGEAGIIVTGVTLNSAGLFHWSKFLASLEPKQKKDRYFLLNADDRTFDLQLLVGGESVYSRSFHIGATQEIQNTLSKEIKLSLELCRRQEKTETGEVSRPEFCMTGTMENFLGMDIESWAGKDFQTFDPLKEAGSRIDLKNSTKGLPVSYAAVLGLALGGTYEGVDLTPRELKASRDLYRKKKIFKRVFLLVCVLLCLVFSAVVSSLQEKISRLNRMEEELARLKGPEKALNTLLLGYYLDKKILKDAFVFDVLGALNETIPAGVTLQSLDMNDARSVLITGSATNVDALIGFFAVLKKEHAYQDVKMDYSQTKEKKNGESVKFRISWSRG